MAISSQEWMTRLPDRTRFFDLLIPGTHDSGTYKYQGVSEVFVRTQDLNSDFADQLNNGIRFLDLRVRKVGDTVGDNLALFHGDGPSFYLDLNLDDALTAVRDFLQSHPGETVVLSIKHEHKQTGGETDITAADIQGYINKYPINSRLPDSDYNNLWVAGPVDFQRITNMRIKHGRSYLNDLNPLETSHPRKPNPLGPNKVIPLSYQNLTLGDVRGRIILYLRDMPGYDEGQYGWDSSNIAPLDHGIASWGIDAQDDYDGPDYDVKKSKIFDHAKRLLANKYSINYTSAASSFINPASSPYSFALTNNTGSTRNNYLTWDKNPSTLSPTVKSSLGIGGELYRWNLAQKTATRTGGLNGAMVGDFMTLSQQHYNDFWDDPSASRTQPRVTLPEGEYATSDHLTRRIWSQNALAVPDFSGAHHLDPVTGIPVFLEEQTGKIKFDSFMELANPSLVTCRILGPTKTGVGLESAANFQTTPVDDAFTFKLLSRNKRSLGFKHSVDPKTRPLERESGKVSMPVQKGESTLQFRVKEGEIDSQGYRLFSLDFLYGSDPVGQSYEFAVADRSLFA